MRKSELNISIVDDDIVDQFHTKIKIEQSGVPCKVSSYDNVHELFDFLEGNIAGQADMPDIVLLDGNALRMDSDIFMESVKRSATLGHYPRIYLLLSYYRPGNIVASEPGLVHGYFPKPISAQDALHILLGEKRIDP